MITNYFFKKNKKIRTGDLNAKLKKYLLYKVYIKIK